ncbi:MAG: GWxTD domain-containing protein [Cytophagales bacterium]|mgnify:CR=1 FL=1|nr:GWxTD domain-containing protein [Cytophagales bacterium]
MRNKRIVGFICFFLAYLPSWSQAVNAINFQYLYDPLNEVSVQFLPVNRGDSIAIVYQVRSNQQAVSYLLTWERKDSYAQRQGNALQQTDTATISSNGLEGQFTFSKPDKPWILDLKITNLSSAKSWHFIRQIEAHHPVNGFMEKDGKRQWTTYLDAESRYRIRGSGSGKPIHISFYKENFTTPSPPFVVKEIKMDRFLFPDSVFSVNPGSELGPFRQEGLYLAQEDTMSARGFSFLMKRDPYPKYNKLSDLKGPLLFVTTREENDALGLAGEDKLKFDKIILDITRDKERARTFMRNYFKRVEYANYYFSSFKEGWKTDRGMIYIIFGPPNEVQLDGQDEIWSYRNPRQEFYFAKAGSVYHPDHAVLVREKKYAEDWYQTIDLWRKSRF